MLVASSVDPVRSANNTVTTLRSSSSGAAWGTTATAGAVASRPVPQAPQNRLAGGLRAPQEGQARSRAEPQVPQNRFPAGFDDPHAGHCRPSSGPGATVDPCVSAISSLARRAVYVGAQSVTPAPFGPFDRRNAGYILRFDRRHPPPVR